MFSKKKRFSGRIAQLLYSPLSQQAGVRVQKKDISYGVTDKSFNPSDIKVDLKKVNKI